MVYFFSIWMCFFFSKDMKRNSGVWKRRKTKQRNNEAYYEIQHTIRQFQTFQTQNSNSKKTTTTSSQYKLASLIPTIATHFTFSFVPMLVLFLFLFLASFSAPVFSSPTVLDPGNHSPANQTFNPGKEFNRLRRTKAYLRKINKPGIKTIQAFFFSFFLPCLWWVFFFLGKVLILFWEFSCGVESWWRCHRLCAFSSSTSFWPSWA